MPIIFFPDHLSHEVFVIHVSNQFSPAESFWLYKPHKWKSTYLAVEGQTETESLPHIALGIFFYLTGLLLVLWFLIFVFLCLSVYACICMLMSVYICLSYFSFTFSAVCIVYSGVFLVCLFSEWREKVAWNWMSRMLRKILKMMREELVVTIYCTEPYFQ